MKNKIKKLYLILGVIFFGIALKASSFKTSMKINANYDRVDLHDQSYTQYVDVVEEDRSNSLIDLESTKEESLYELTERHESVLEQQMKIEQKEAIRLFRNPKFTLAVLTNNKHNIMIQLQKGYLDGTVSGNLIESIILSNAFKLSQEDVKELRLLIGIPSNDSGTKSLL